VYIKKIIKKILSKNQIEFLRKIKQKILHKRIRLKDYYLLPKSKVTYAEDLLYSFHNIDFTKEPLFEEAYNLGKNTDTGLLLKDYDIRWRIHVLCWAASHAKHLEGDFVDCGVCTGICARAVIHYIDFNSLDKKYYLLDTFCGMDPKYSSDYEIERNKIIGYSEEKNVYEQVKRTFFGFNVEIIKGSIPDSLVNIKTQKVCYLSIDMNCVKPEIAALEFFWDKMTKGGIIILDDYAYPGCAEQKAAHDTFATSKGVKILTLATSQGLIIKP
jgi:O-methyltransferase